METMSTLDQIRGDLSFAPPPHRPVHAAAVVTTGYLLMVLAAPWIIRYAPASESAVAAQIAERTEPLRCASAPVYGLPCGVQLPWNAPATAQARLGGEVVPRV